MPVAGDMQLVFYRGKSFLPYLDVNGTQYPMEELVKRSGDGSDEMPDKTNRYSSVKLVENSAARAVVLWRYAPNFTDDAQINQVPFDGFVDEYFTVYPDGTVYRTMR